MSFQGMLNNDYKSRIDTPEILQRLMGALLTLPDLTPDRQELRQVGPKGGQSVRNFIRIFSECVAKVPYFLVGGLGVKPCLYGAFIFTPLNTGRSCLEGSLQNIHFEGAQCHLGKFAWSAFWR